MSKHISAVLAGEMSLAFPGNINFSGTVSAPLFVSNQQIIAPVAAGTASTLTVNSISSNFGSLTQAYTATLSVGTILNFSAGGSIGTNLALTGTLTAATAVFSGSVSAVGNVLSSISGRSYIFNSGLISNAAGSTTDVGAGNVGVVFSAGGNIDLVNAATTSMLRMSGTCLGISQTSPSYTLDVNGSARLNNALFSSVSTSLILSNQNQAGSTTTAFSLYQGAAGDTVLNSSFGSPLVFKIGNVEYARLSSSGMWGINTASPSYPLDVSGNARVTAGSLSVINSSVPAAYVYSSSNNTRLNIDSASAYQSGISFQLSGAETAVFYRPASSTDQRMYLSSAGDLMTWTNTSPGKIGINNVSPSYTLDCSGTARFSGTGTPFNSLILQNTGGGPTVSGAALSFRGYQMSTGFTAQIKSTDGQSGGYGGQLQFLTKPANNSDSNNLTEVMRITDTGMVGIGTTAPLTYLHVVGGSTTSVNQMQLQPAIHGNPAAMVFNTYGANFSSNPITRIAAFDDGNGGGYLCFQTNLTTRMTIYNNGSVNVAGALSKGSGTFKIKHPSRQGFDLLHSFIEGPRCDLIYRGQSSLVDGQASVDLDAECTGNGIGMTPGTFEALCRDPQVWVQNIDTWDLLRGQVTGSVLHVLSNNPESKANFSWMVVAERKDDHIVRWDMTDDEGRLVLEHASVEE